MSVYVSLSLMLGMLGKIFNQRHFDLSFLFFPENRIRHYMQIVSAGDNLHRMSNSIFSENKKKYC